MLDSVSIRPRITMERGPRAATMPTLHRLLVTIVLVGLAAAQGTPSVGPVVEAPPGAYVATIRGPLDAGHQALFQRAIRRAKADDAALVLEFDTPGGRLTTMRQFAAAIDEARSDGVLVIGWIHDEALSAGTWLAIACDSLYATTRGTLGAAQAVVQTPGGLAPAAEKYASTYRVWVRAWAESHGRSPLLAQAMIDPDTEVRRVRIDGMEELVSGDEWFDLADRGEEPELLGVVVPKGRLWALTGTEAVEYGFTDAVAESLDEVLAKQGLAGVRVERLERSRSEDLLSGLVGMRLLLLFLGLFFGYVELKMPGVGVPGVLSVLAFVALFGAQYLVGLADVPHLALAGIGIVLVAAELFVLPGMIWPGLVGAACVIVGLLLGQVGPGVSLSSAWDREILFDATFQLVLTATAALVSIWMISRYLPNTPLLGRMVLAAGPTTSADAMPEATDDARLHTARVGAIGRAATRLRPVGKVVLDGDTAGTEHEARAESGLLEAGVAVEVVEVSAGRLVVRACGEGVGP